MQPNRAKATKMFNYFDFYLNKAHKCYIARTNFMGLVKCGADIVPVCERVCATGRKVYVDVLGV